MKKLSLLFAAVAVFVSCNLRAEVVEIGSAEGLATAIGANPAGDYKLTADIDCTGWTTCDFSGTLDGAGKSIKGLTVPLFTNLAGEVDNLTFDGSVGGVNTTITLPDRTDFGILALTTTAAHVEGVNVKGYSLVNKQSADKNKSQNSIGFLVACALDGSQFVSDMTMEGCTVSLGGDLGFGGIVGGVFRSGEFTGTCAAEFSGCINNVAITLTSGCSAAGNGGVGGILGRDRSGLDSKRLCEIVFTDCINNGSVAVKSASGNTAFGGIIGQAFAGIANGGGGNELYLANCVNHGSFTAPDGASCNNMRLGGLIGMCGRYFCSICFDKCLNDGDITVLPSSAKGGTFGGFIGYAYDVSKNTKISVLNSVTRGNILTTVRDGYVNQVGRFCGNSSLNKSYAGVSVTIANSSFGGVLSASVTGGLFGQLGSGAVHDGMTFAVDNCWLADDLPLVDDATKAALEAYAHYLITNPQFHTAGEDEAENAALALVAAGNDDYVTWLVSDKSGHPEPVLGATMYTVIFKDWDDAVLSLQQVEEGAAAEAPDDPVRVGYKFTGWDPSDFSEVTSNMTIVATYEQSEDFRTVTFVDWDGTELAQVTVEAGTAIGGKAPQPTRTGYTLVGWTLDGEPYGLNAAVMEDITLDAAYQINVYDVVFFDWDDNQLGETQKVAYLDSAVAPALPPIPDGKVFWKWSDDISSVTEDMEVIAMICDAEQTISSAEDFAAKINAQTPSVVHFTLEADIVLENWTSVDFSASLDGQGHGISGLTKPLFGALTGATVENLVISNSTVDAAASGEIAGLLARTAGDGTTISHVQTGSDCTVGVGINVIAGGIVGELSNTKTDGGGWDSWIVDSTNRASLAKTSTDSNSTGAFAGIVGRIKAKGATGQPFVTNGVLRCANFGPLICNHNGGRMGGLVGKFATENDKALSAVIDSGNFADLIGDTQYGSDAYKKLYAGGLVSVVSTTTYDALIDGCVNRGNVSVGFEPDGQTDNLDKTAGGMIAHVEDLSKGATLTIRNSANYGDVTGENAAGVIATFGANPNYTATKCEIENCACYGSVAGRTCAALAVGDWDKPKVAFTRMIDNSFFVADAGLGLPVVGGSEEGFVLTNLAMSTDDDYTCATARQALNLVAAENGYGQWVDGNVGGIDYPELKIFCANPPTVKGLMLLFR